MKTTTVLTPLVALALLTLITACIFSDDKDGGSLEHAFTGSLANLERITDTNTTELQWKLRVDLQDDPVLRGMCRYQGYLGDSTRVNAEETDSTLYTNTRMGGSRNASEFRANGVILSMDSAQQMDTLTHYRAEFHCTY